MSAAAAPQTAQRLQNGWEVCAGAVSEMSNILDGLSDYPDLCGETAALREQLKCISDLCGQYGGEPITKDDPKRSARQLVEQLPLEEIFRDQALKDAFLSELMLALARQSSYTDRRERQKAGIREAKAQGVRFGAPARPLPANFEEMRRAWRSGQLTVKEAAERCGLARTTFYNAAHRVEKAMDVM